MKFITFEGVDGVGKSTIIKEVADNLTNKGYEVVTTREPGGSELAESIRNLLLDTKYDIDKDTEMLLFFAARCFHVKEVIIPALQSNRIVLCDRYYHSTLAYQCSKQEIDKELQSLDVKYPWLIHPDKTIFLDTSDQIIAERLSFRGNIPDRMERNTKRKVVRENFYHISRRLGNKFSLYNASSNIKDLSSSITEDILQLLTQ